MLDKVPQDIVDTLAAHDQSHLCRWWNDLDHDQRDGLVSQIREIDFAQIDQLAAEYLKATTSPADDRAATATAPSNLERLSGTGATSGGWSAATRLGENLLREGKVAAMVVAGGQGSRLGFDQPKGMFPIGPVTGKTLFQLHFEQLEALSMKFGVGVPYFIMTSEATDATTKEFLEANDYFGYSFHDVYIFKQGWLPAVDSAGKILLAGKAKVATSPDGHGGMLNALKRAGLTEIMREREIEHVYYHQVDNPTAIICDPTFIGLHAKCRSGMSTKVVAKTGPEEKMGVVVDVDGITQIIEYSDLSAEQQAATDAQGELLLWAGNTAIHAFRRELLDQLTEGDSSLPYHKAHKKVAYVADSGEVVTPEEPNAYKFEQFIFDALPKADNALVVEADRGREFNPVKNAEGADSPATAQAALLELGRHTCEEAGAIIEPDARIEVSPVVAFDLDSLRDRLSRSKPLSGDVAIEPIEPPA